MIQDSTLYSIGIDLGTTSSSLAFISPGSPEGSSPTLLPIPQWENEEQIVADPRLPSFLWILPKNRWKKLYAQSLMKHPLTRVPGRLAREHSLNESLEVIHSAKSWLSIGKNEQRTGKILPWGSAGEKISPLEVQTSLLSHLRDAWNIAHPAHPIAEQRVVITVPASFDELAQRLTLEAARDAGLGPVELLEEPIAAFYDWQAYTSSQTESLPLEAKVLVCDLGGGTTDFSLLSVGPKRTERLKVSDHLLLGGDNIDLSLTHRITQRLSPMELPREAYNRIFTQVRTLKEKALASTKGETFHLSVPLDPKNLFGQYLSASLAAEEIRDWILADFFPLVARDTKTERSTGLQSWGLPYARDTRVTAHLAEFLGGTPIDAILCVGGTLIPDILKDRIQETIQSWQTSPIKKLSLDSRDLAIALGAARFAHKRSMPASAQIIHSPYPRDLILEVESLGDVCLIPKGHPRMSPYAVKTQGLHLRLGEDVRFQVYALSAKGDRSALPPLFLRLRSKKKGSIAVRLESIVRETGVLELTCLSEEGTFTLDFALEAKVQRSETSIGAALDFSTVPQLNEAREAIKRAFHKNSGRAQKPEKLPSELEAIFKMPREEWSAKHLRGLWSALEATMFQRNLSTDHEATWFYLAGFSLRPGFGYQGDEDRMVSLLRIYDESFRRVDQEAKLLNQWWILWRRLAGGLAASYQQKIYDRYIPAIRKEKDPSPELLRLLAALERLDTGAKLQLGRQLLNHLGTSKSQQDTKLWALARLANRYPVYAPASAVLAPAVVEEWADEILLLNLSDKAKSSLFFAWAGRMRGDKRYDIDPHYREKFLAEVENPEWRRALTEVVIPDSVVQTQMLADSLPSGFYFSG